MAHSRNEKPVSRSEEARACTGRLEVLLREDEREAYTARARADGFPCDGPGRPGLSSWLRWLAERRVMG